MNTNLISYSKFILALSGYERGQAHKKKIIHHFTNLEARKSMSDLITSWIGLLGDARQIDSSADGAEITGTLVGDITVSQVPGIE